LISGVTVASTAACATVVFGDEIAVVEVSAPVFAVPVPVALTCRFIEAPFKVIIDTFERSIREMIEVQVEVPAWLAMLFIVVGAVVFMGPAGRDVTDVVCSGWAAAVVNIPRVTVASTAACAASLG